MRFPTKVQSNLTVLYIALACCSQVAANAHAGSAAAYEKTVVLFSRAEQEKKADLINSPLSASAGLTNLQMTFPASGVAVLGPIKSESGPKYGGLENLKALQDFCRKLSRANPQIRCEPNYIYRIQAGALNDPSAGENWALLKINVALAWNYTLGSHQVKVAVIDSGVDYNHPSLHANVAINTGEVPNNGVDDDGNGYIDDAYGYDFVDNDPDPADQNGHGTHVAGIIGALNNNGFGATGLNRNVGIIPVRVLNERGIGTLANIAAGIKYALKRGAHIINLSMGGPYASSLFKSALEQASAQGVLVVAAAGNNAQNLEFDPVYPASFKLPNLIAVAAANGSDSLASFSNFGAKTVHLAAPGVGVYGLFPGASFCYFSGTSTAAPHVAGTAALLKSLYFHLTALDLKEYILQTVDPFLQLQGVTASSGRLNAGQAVALAAEMLSLHQAPDSLNPTPNDQAPMEALSLKVFRSKRSSIKLRGKIYDLQTGQGLAGRPGTLICNKKHLKSVTSTAKGLLPFGKLPRPKRRALICHATNGTAYSKQVRIKPKAVH